MNTRRTARKNAAGTLCLCLALSMLLALFAAAPAWADNAAAAGTSIPWAPELLQMQDGTPVRDEAQWRARRREILGILQREIYGYMPPVLSPGRGEVTTRRSSVCEGRAYAERVLITAETERGPFSFPLRLVLPKDAKNVPLILMINFRRGIFDKYIDTQAILDRGYGLAVVCYRDISSDSNARDGLARCFSRPGNGTGFGKITLWAWGLSRAMDYLITRPEIDAAHVTLAGHSRLGKTALWAAAQDERFFCVIANESGCAGAALERGHHAGAETAALIADFPHWFCENYFRYGNAAEQMPFDQHFLLAAIAPRLVAVGSASLDAWADPYNEQLCCAAASPAWQLMGRPGFIGTAEQARPGESFQRGEIGYHLRPGEHGMTAEDWKLYLDFLDRHRADRVFEVRA